MEQFRRFVIKTAEVFVVILVVLMTLSFASSAYAFGGIVGFLVGGAFGFVLSSLLAATFFLLAEIAENTRGYPQERGYGRQ